MPKVTKSADREEGEQLHQRLEGDRRHHALVALGGVEVARAEQDGERGEHHRDVERVVAAGTAARLCLSGITISGYCSTIEKLFEIAFSCSEM